MKNETTVNIVHSKHDSRQSDEKNERRKLQIRVIHQRDKRDYAIKSDYFLTDEEFKNKRLTIHKKAFTDAEFAKGIAQQVIAELGDEFTFPEFKKRYDQLLYGNYKTTKDLQYVYDRYLENPDRIHAISSRTKRDYQTAVNWAIKYKSSVKIGDFSKDFIRKLEDYIKKENENVSENTIRMYFRELKAIYNFAVAQKMVTNKEPFKGRTLNSTRKSNFGLSVETLKKIVDYSSEKPLAQMGRDFFVLSFALNGHYLSDVLRLKNSNLIPSEESSTGFRVGFVRKKVEHSGNEVFQNLHPTAKQILEKYGQIDLDAPDAYILPYLVGANAKQEYDRIHDFNAKINDGLKIVASDLSLQHFTIDQARHTYATTAYQSNRNLLYLSKDLGHSDTKTTIGYVNSLSSSSLQ